MKKEKKGDKSQQTYNNILREILFSSEFGGDSGQMRINTDVDLPPALRMNVVTLEHIYF